MDETWVDDFQPSEVGAEAGSAPNAVGVDDLSAVFAMTHGAAGDALVFGARRLPWNMTTSPSSASTIRSTHTLSAPLAGDPVLVKTTSGWTALWIEGASLFVRSF